MLPTWIIAEVERRRREQEREAEERRPELRVELPDLPPRDRPLPAPGSTVIVIEIG